MKDNKAAKMRHQLVDVPHPCQKPIPGASLCGLRAAGVPLELNGAAFVLYGALKILVADGDGHRITMEWNDCLFNSIFGNTHIPILALTNSLSGPKPDRTGRPTRTRSVVSGGIFG